MKEIEKKYLVKELPDLSKCKKSNIIQGYISYNPETRIRKIDNSFFITYKSNEFLIRDEDEKEIDEEKYNILFKKIKNNIIYKTRYYIKDKNYLYELDIYHGSLEGLITVEVEFQNLNDALKFKPPLWFGIEITNNIKYKNSSLSKIKNDV